MRSGLKERVMGAFSLLFGREGMREHPEATLKKRLWPEKEVGL
jgi:hypothetical protein